MSDRQKAEDVFNRMVYALDRGEWDVLGAAMTEDFEYRFKDPYTGEEDFLWFKGRDEAVGRLRGFSETLLASQHFCPNLLVEFDGDKATVLANHLSYVVPRPPEGEKPEVRNVLARWTAHLRRDGDSYICEALVFEVVMFDPWIDDLRSFPPRGPIADEKAAATTTGGIDRAAHRPDACHPTRRPLDPLEDHRRL
jgi:hypothetical protein